MQKNGLPGEGRHEGLVPRNDVLTSGSYSGRKNVMSMRELFCPYPLAGFEKMVITLSLLNFLEENLIVKRNLTTLISLRCTGNVHA